MIQFIKLIIWATFTRYELLLAFLHVLKATSYAGETSQKVLVETLKNFSLQQMSWARSKIIAANHCIEKER